MYSFYRSNDNAPSSKQNHTVGKQNHSLTKSEFSPQQQLQLDQNNCQVQNERVTFNNCNFNPHQQAETNCAELPMSRNNQMNCHPNQVKHNQLKYQHQHQHQHQHQQQPQPQQQRVSLSLNLKQPPDLQMVPQENQPQDQIKIINPMAGLQQQLQLAAALADQQHQQQQQATPTTEQNKQASGGQYFMRSSLNESIKMRRSQRRSQRRSGRRANRLGLGGPTAGVHHQLRRQVRFQPIPQAINISAYSSSSSSGTSQPDDEGDSSRLSSDLSGLEQIVSYSSLEQSGKSQSTATNLSSSSSTTTNNKGRHHLNIKRMQKQLSRFGNKSRIRAVGVKTAKFSSKPFQQLMSNNSLRLFTFGGKIKSFASHLHQSLGSSSGNHNLTTTATTTTTMANNLTIVNSQRRANNGQASSSCLSSTPKLAPLEKTFHLRHSAATAKNQITLISGKSLDLSQVNQKVIAPLFESTTTATTSNVNTSSQQQRQPNVFTNVHSGADLDDGWGSDFDESQSTCAGGTNLSEHAFSLNRTSSGRNQLRAESLSIDSTTTAPGGGGGGGYLLEIGKSSCDTRAITDVIQDQGICGQFKRLHDVSLVLDVAYRPPSASSSSPLSPGAGDDKASAAPEFSPKTETSGKMKVQQQQKDTEDEAEDEADLKSLEARQGYRQVRDKLKLILDRRLATFERDLIQQTTPTEKSNIAECKQTINYNEPNSEHCQSDRSHSLSSGGAGNGGGGSGAGDLLQCARGDTLAPSSSGVNKCHESSSAVVVVEVQVDQFDCQSNCSEASSLSSGGLESNHSGSQDSGHSTQHSGYSAIGQMHQQHRHHHQQRGQHFHHQQRHLAAEQAISGGGGGGGAGFKTTERIEKTRNIVDDTANHPTTASSTRSPTTSTETSPAIELDSGASTCGDFASQSPSSPPFGPPGNSCKSSTPPGGDQQHQQMGAKISSGHGGTPESCRNTNNKHNDKLVPREGDCVNGERKEQSGEEQQQQQEPLASAIECQERRNRFIQNRLLINSKLESMFKSHCSLNNNSNNTNDSPTKSIQSCPTPNVASNKKQPARQPVNINRCQLLTSCQSEPSIGAASFSVNKQQQQPPLDPATRLRLLEQQRQMSLKLRQKPRRRTAKRALNLECNDGDGASSSASSSSGCNGSLDGQTITSKPAMSLRQLVKEVIDDCEKPNKLSTLTRNILTRSDSLSSGDGDNNGHHHHHLCE